MRHLINIILFSLLLTSCKHETKVDNKEELTSKITYLQIDSGMTHINYVEHLDSANRIIERIKYSEDGLIVFIDKNYYDSLNRPSLSTRTGFSKNKQPWSTTWKTFYDNFGLKTKEVQFNSWNNGDTVITTNTYSEDRKLIKQKVATTSTVMWKGIRHFIYDRNKLIRAEDLDFDELNVTSHDSIVYTDTSKVIYKFYFCNRLSEKTAVTLRNDKPIKELNYHSNAFGGGMYLSSQTIYSYDKLDSLVKKEEITFANTEWCGVKNPERKMTYIYEQKKR